MAAGGILFRVGQRSECINEINQTGDYADPPSTTQNSIFCVN